MEDILRHAGESRCVTNQICTGVIVDDLLNNWIGYFIVEESIVASGVQHLFAWKYNIRRID